MLQDVLSHSLPADIVSVIPLSRWDVDQTAAMYSSYPSRFVTALPAVDAFDNALFAVTAPEARLLDPQQRLVLQLAADLMATGFSAAGRHEKNTGVFVGVSSLDYARLAQESWEGGDVSPFAATSGTASVIPGRVSYTFGFEVRAVVAAPCSIPGSCGTPVLCSTSVPCSISVLYSKNVPAVLSRAVCLSCALLPR